MVARDHCNMSRDVDAFPYNPAWDVLYTPDSNYMTTSLKHVAMALINTIVLYH